MRTGLRTLGIIPARGGSKSIRRKNLQFVAGKSLLSHAAEAARGASRLARVIVSTDDDEIAAEARANGIDVPFRRPPELASDSARAIPVLQHALEAVEQQEGLVYDAVMMLQPTTPFRQSGDIDGAIALCETTGCDSVISVVGVGAYHPARMKYLEGDRLVDPLFCETEENQPRQELREMWLRNGAIYLVRRATLLGGSLKGRDCRAWPMPEERSVNIDSGLDLLWARALASEGLV